MVLQQKEAGFGAMADLVSIRPTWSATSRARKWPIVAFYERLEKKRATVEDNFVSAL